MDSFFPDVLTFPEDGHDGQMDASFNGMSSDQIGFFSQQGGFQESNTDLNSFFTGTGLTPLGTPGMSMFANSQSFPWNESLSGYSVPQEMQQDMSLDPNTVAGSTLNTNSNSTSDKPNPNDGMSQLNNDTPGEDSSKPKRGRPRKKRDKKQLSVEEENAKRQKFLERNRLAASKCRDRKKNWTQDTMDRLAREEKKHVDLQMEFSRLQAECASLMEAACQHIGHCDKNDGFQESLAQSSQRFASIVQAYSEAVGVLPLENEHEQFDIGNEADTPQSSDDQPHKRSRSESNTDEGFAGSLSPATPQFSNREIRAIKRQPVAPAEPILEETSGQSSRMSRQPSANSSGSSGLRDSGISSLGSPIKANSQSPTDEGFFGSEDRTPTGGPLMMPNPRVSLTPQVKLEALLRARNFSAIGYPSRPVDAR